MSTVFYVVSTDSETGVQNVAVFVPGRDVATADSTHPNFDRILDEVRDGADESVLDLFDVADTVAKIFEPLSERVTVANGQVFFDGDPVDNVLTKQIVRFLNEGVSEWIPLVDFFENVAANPQEHSREQLYEWLDRRDFSIAAGGMIVGYRGLRADLTSVHSGPGIVNGEAVNGHLDNTPGNTIEMARSSVEFNPGLGCSYGLHVGTYDYAKSWSNGGLVKVLVNPRDVVSVPTDCDAAKMRVCRYVVVEEIAAPVTSAYDDYDYDKYDEFNDDDDTEDEDTCPVCGDPDCTF